MTTLQFFLLWTVVTGGVGILGAFGFYGNFYALCVLVFLAAWGATDLIYSLLFSE